MIRVFGRRIPNLRVRVFRNVYMDDFFKKLHIVMKSVRLDHDTKKAMRNRLVFVMESGDMRRGLSARTMAWGWLFRPAFFSFTILSLIGGGTSFAAEGSLPGDLLYLVKVHVNEEVRAVLALSPAAKTDWEVTRAERRLEEAAQLVVSGNEDERITKDLEDRFVEHANNVSLRVQDLEDEGEGEQASVLVAKFEATLRAHDELLQNLEGDRLAVKARAQSFREKVYEEVRDFEDARISFETKATLRAQERAREAAEDKLRVAESLLSSPDWYRPMRVKASSTTEVDARVQAARDILTEGHRQFDAALYEEAFVLAQEAIHAAQAAQAFAQAQARYVKLGLPTEGGVSLAARTETKKDKQDDDRSLSYRAKDIPSRDVRERDNNDDDSDTRKDDDEDSNTLSFQGLRVAIPDDVVRGTYAIRSQDEWEAVMGDAGTAPVDFKERIVLAAFSGLRATGGYIVRIDNVEIVKNNITVRVTETIPGDACMVTQAFTAPYDMVSIEKTDKSIEFIITEETRDCR